MNKFLLTSLLLAGLIQASGQTSTPDSIAKMPQPDSAELYGFIKERPIKVGGKMESGPAQQRKYLESLRDAQNNPVKFERLGSCCEYPSENGLFGLALLDKYEIRYRDEANKKQKVTLYISFYDYEEPKAVKGFTLVK